MKSRNVVLMAGAIVWMFSASAMSQNSTDWVDIKDPKELRALYSNKTFHGKVVGGPAWVAYHRSDGKALLVINGKKIPRTWRVKGNDQVCVTTTTETTCYTYQRNRKNPNEILLYDAKDGLSMLATVQDGVPDF
jgi:hypothetical protein